MKQLLKYLIPAVFIVGVFTTVFLLTSHDIKPLNLIQEAEACPPEPTLTICSSSSVQTR